MYSMVLFMVDLSFISLTASGLTQTSAVLSIASISSSGMRPVKVTKSATPSSVASVFISSSEVQYDVLHRPKQVVDPFLPSHHADVPDQVTAAALEPLVGRQDLHALEARAAAHDEHALAKHPAASDRDTSVGLVDGDRHIGGAEGPVLEREHQTMEEIAPTELCFVELGAQIVVI